MTQGTAPALSVAVNINNQLAGSPYSYDAAGNMLADAVNTYTWTAEGKMASVTSSLYGSANYVYDGDGHRVEKSTGKLYWYGTDGNVLAESDLSGNITDEYIFFGGKRIARVDAQGNVDYYLADSLGSARVVTDANGNILDDCDFLPFGDEQCVTSSSGNPYKFTGKERDPESQLDHFYARNYSSQYGRFVSPDGSPEPKPAPYADLSDPQTLNLYSYVANNPLRRTDPDGHGMWDDFKKLFEEPFGDNAPTIPQQEAAQQQSAQKISKDKIVDTMDKNAHGTNTYNGYCATACRKGLQAGGVKVPLVNGHRYPNASEYGPILLKNGASIVPPKGYVPQRGDIVVFGGGGPHNHPNGHIAIYDGKQWVSDTRQTQMAPNRSGYPGGYTIYRFPD